MFYLKVRAITSGETPQKSLILPPVHIFVKVIVAPVNIMFSYFYRVSGGVKIVIFHDFCQKVSSEFPKFL